MERISIIPIEHASQTAEARRVAVRLAQSLQFQETAQNNLSIVVTEAATNLLKHAGGGQIILRPTEAGGGIEVLAADKGPGIGNVSEAMRDGHSTYGSAGIGLGAISRLSASHDVYSTCPGGTIVQAICMPGGSSALEESGWDVSSMVDPKPGEEGCGDVADAYEVSGNLRLLLADGLGHGILAASASRAAAQVFYDRSGEPKDVMTAMQPALFHTRGAAVAVAEIQPEQGRLLFCGVGNVCALVFGGERTQHGISTNGIVGQNATRLRQYEIPWMPRSVVVMHSDGLSSRWTLDDYPGLSHRSSSMIAAALFRDHRRLSDDASVLVAKPRQQWS